MFNLFPIACSVVCCSPVCCVQPWPGLEAVRGRGSCGSCGSSAHLDGEVELVRLLLGLTAAQAGQLGQGGADLRRGERLLQHLVL